MAARSPTKRETWRDWLPRARGGFSRREIASFVNISDTLEPTVSEEDLEQWERDGLLPEPGGEHGYPGAARQVVISFVQALQEGHSPQEAREQARKVADELNYQSKRETWLDWMPEGAPMPDLLSHDQLLEELHSRGVDLTSASFQHYRQRGVLPRPIRRRYEGVTQAVYPDWFIPAIEHLRRLQSEGKSLEEIRPWMRSWALSSVLWSDPYARELVALRGPLRDLARAVGSEVNTITVTLTDHDGTEVFRHVLPAPED